MHIFRHLIKLLNTIIIKSIFEQWYQHSIDSITLGLPKVHRSLKYTHLPQYLLYTKYLWYWYINQIWFAKRWLDGLSSPVHTHSRVTETEMERGWHQQNTERCLKALLCRGEREPAHRGASPRPVPLLHSMWLTATEQREELLFGKAQRTGVSGRMTISIQETETLENKHITGAVSQQATRGFVNIPGALILWAYLSSFLLPYYTQKRGGSWVSMREQTTEFNLGTYFSFFPPSFSILESSLFAFLNLILTFVTHSTKRLLHAW